MSEPGADAPIRVLVVDDQQIMREGLMALLDLLDGIEVVGDAADGRQALELLDVARPDVVLMDLRMPVMDGVQTTEALRRDRPDIAVLVLTTYDDDDSVARALHAGAHGYLTKEAGRVEIAAALRAAAAGHATFAPSVSARLVAALPPAGSNEPATRDRPVGPPDGLTPREVEVLSLVARGLTNVEIGRTLFIGETTVKTHTNNAFAKIGVRNRAEATRYAHDHGLTAPGPGDGRKPGR